MHGLTGGGWKRKRYRPRSKRKLSGGNPRQERPDLQPNHSPPRQPPTLLDRDHDSRTDARGFPQARIGSLCVVDHHGEVAGTPARVVLLRRQGCDRVFHAESREDRAHQGPPAGQPESGFRWQRPVNLTDPGFPLAVPWTDAIDASAQQLLLLNPQGTVASGWEKRSRWEPLWEGWSW